VRSHCANWKPWTAAGAALGGRHGRLVGASEDVGTGTGMTDIGTAMDGDTAADGHSTSSGSPQTNPAFASLQPQIALPVSLA